jgi:hypothetical protein
MSPLKIAHANRGSPLFHSWKQGFLQEAALQAHQMKLDRQQLFTSVFHLYLLFFFLSLGTFVLYYINKIPQQGSPFL